MKKIILSITLVTYSSTAITSMQQRMTKTYNAIVTPNQARVAPQGPLPVATLVSDPIPHAILIPVVAQVIPLSIPATSGTPRNQSQSIVVVFNTRQGAETTENPIDHYVPARQLPRELLQGPEDRYRRQHVQNDIEEFNRIRDILEEQESIQPDEDRRQCCLIS